jgi:hypothetical protein
MSRDLREEVARALYVAKGAHNVFGPWEAQLYQSLKEPFRRQANSLIDPIVERELSIAIPRIEAETREACAKVAEGLASAWGEFIGGTPERDRIAAAIRNQEPKA